MKEIIPFLYQIIILIIFQIVQSNSLEIELAQSTQCLSISNIGGNSAMVSSIVYIEDSTLASVCDTKGDCYIYDIFDGRIHSKITQPNPPILEQIFYPNLIQTILSKKKFTVINVLTKEEIFGIQSLDQDIDYLGMIKMDLSETSDQSRSLFKGAFVLMNNRKTQILYFKPSSEQNNYYPTSPDFDYAIKVQTKAGSNNQNQIFGKSSSTYIDMYVVIEDYKTVAAQNFPEISPNSRASMVIAMNQGSVITVYGYLINLSLIRQQKLIDYVSPVILPAYVNEFILLENTTYALISYGLKYKFQGGDKGGNGGGGQGGQTTSPLPLKENNLCIYDFGQAQQLDDSLYGVNTLQVLMNPKVCIDQASDPILALENMFVNDKNYLVFSLASSSLIIFDVNDLLTQNFDLSKAKKLSFSNSILKENITYLLKIPNVPILLVGSSTGTFASFDISDPLLISDDTASTTQINPLYVKNGTGQSDLIGDCLYDETTKSLFGITKSSTQRLYGFQYDLSKQQRVKNKTFNLVKQQGGGGQQNNKQLTVEQSVIFNDFSVVTLASTAKQFYLIDQLVTCPDKNPNPAPTLIAVKSLSIYNSFKADSQTVELDLKTNSINPQTVIGLVAYTTENNTKLSAVLFTTKPLVFNLYCEYQSNRRLRFLQNDNLQNNISENEELSQDDEIIKEQFKNDSVISESLQNNIQKQQKHRILQDTSINLQLYIFNGLGVPVFKTDTTFLTFDSIELAPFQFFKDSVNNLFAIFTDSILIVKPALNTATSIQKTTIPLLTLETLISNNNIKKIVKVSAIQHLNILLIQFDLNDDSQLSIMVSYNQQWFNDPLIDLQIKLINTFDVNTKLDLQPFIRFNTVHFMEKQSIIVLQYNTKISMFKFNQDTSSLTLHLTLNNIADANTLFFSSPSTESLILLFQDGEIIRVHAPNCYEKSCVMSQCSLQFYINQQKSNQLVDVMKQDHTSTILLKQEQLLKSVLNYSQLIQRIQQIDIQRSYYFASGSIYYAQLVHFKQIVSQDSLKQNQIILRLRIHAYDSKSANNSDEGILEPFIFYGNDPTSFENYEQVSMKNINWKINFDKYPNKTKSLLQLFNNYLLFDNFSMNVYSDNPNTILSDSFCRIDVQSGKQGVFKNWNMDGKKYNKANYLIQTPSNAYEVELDNITVTNSIFDWTVFILPNDIVNLVISNATFESNVITLNPINSDFDTFIQASSMNLDKFYFKKNAIESVIILAKKEPSPNCITVISNSEISQNFFFYNSNDSKPLFFNVQYLATQPNPTSLTLTSVQFFQNQIYSSNYDKQIYQDYLTKLQTPIPTPPDNQIDDSDQNDLTNKIFSTDQPLFFFQTQYIKQVSFNDVTSQDNNRIGFYLGSYMNKFDGVKFKCGNTILSQTVANSPCLKITEYTNIAFELNESELYNQYIQNDFLLSLKTSYFLSSLQSSYASTIKINGLKIKNIMLCIKTEYNQASTVFFSSLQNNLININKFTVQNILLQTPQKVFYDMASSLSILAPFSTAFLIESTFTNLYTQSMKEGVYLNVQDLTLTNNSFENNQYQTKSTFQGSNGGFISIRASSVEVTKNDFNKGSSLSGSALTIIPTKKEKKFTFTNCHFTNLISSKYGSAIYIVEPPSLTQFIFNSCSFQSLLASDGGSIYINYLLSENELKPGSSNINYPILKLISPRVSQTFALNQGSFVTLQNIKTEIQDFISDINDPDTSVAIQDSIITNKIQQIPTIGSLFYLYNTALKMESSKMFKSYVKPEQLSATILTLQKSSQVDLQSVTILEGSFQLGGCILVEDKSKINILTLEMSKMNFQVPKSRILQSEINGKIDLNQLISNLISPFLIKNKSTFIIDGLTMNNNQCLFDLCVGGALSIVLSEGNLVNSHFENNISKNKGGALAILSPSNNVLIKNTEFIKNSANQEGGAIFIYTENGKIQIQISDQTKVLNNLASLGGGIYLNCQDTSKINPNSPKWMSIIDTTIMKNEASFLGGGIQYEGTDPYISSSTIISDNMAGKGFGSNLFSKPVKFKFNEELTKKYNEEAVDIKITQDSQLGVEHISLGIQTSGIFLPNIIFNLVDDKGQNIDSSYETYINTPIYSYIQPIFDNSAKDTFMISESSQKFEFTDYFNLTGIKITGIPNSRVSLKFSTPFINNPSLPENSYYVILDIYLRECERGEVYKTIQYITPKQTSQFYECQKCSQGFYSLAIPSMASPVYECQKCKESTECEGGDQIDVDPGFWRESTEKDEIFKCVNREDNCLGGLTNSTCAPGHIGPLCESCDIENGFSRQGNFQCSECDDPVGNTFKVLGLVILYIITAKLSVDGVLQRILSIFKKTEQIKKQAQKVGVNNETINQQIEQEEHNTSILLKLIINYFQIVLVITTFQINVPNVFNNPIEVVANPTVQVLYSFECFFHEISKSTGVNIIYVQIIASVTLPLICALVFIITGLISYRDNPYLRKFYINTSLIYCLMYFQPSIFKDTISILSCRLIGENSYIQYNVMYKCYTDEHILWSLSLVLPILLIITLIIPGTIFFKIFRCKDSILKKKNFAFLIAEYRSEAWFWEFVKMYTKLLIMAFLSIYEYKIPNKILFILLTVAVYGFLLFKFKPYTKQLYNTIDNYSTAVLVSSIYLGFVAYENQNSLMWRLISIIGIAAINTIFLIWCIRKLARACYPLVKKTFFEWKFLFFKFSPFRCCYTTKTARIYKFQRWVKSVQNELKKRNIINAWTGKIKVPLEDILDLIIQGREQMKNGSKVDFNTSMRNKSHKQIPSSKQIDTHTAGNKQTLNIIPDQINKLQQESINLEFPSENLMVFSPNNVSQNILTAQQIPQTFQNKNEFKRGDINRLKSCSILMTNQEHGNQKTLIEIINLQEQQNTNRNLLSPTPTGRLNDHDQFGGSMKIISEHEIDNTNSSKFKPTEQFKNVYEVQDSDTQQQQSSHEDDAEIPIEHEQNHKQQDQKYIDVIQRNVLESSDPPTSQKSICYISSLKEIKSQVESIQLESNGNLVLLDHDQQKNGTSQSS